MLSCLTKEVRVGHQLNGLTSQIISALPPAWRAHGDSVYAAVDAVIDEAYAHLPPPKEPALFVSASTQTGPAGDWIAVAPAPPQAPRPQTSSAYLKSLLDASSQTERRDRAIGQAAH